jgi:CBS domain containing-hemolysin-like protein
LGMVVVVLPSLRLTSHNVEFAALCAPPLAAAMRYVHPLLDWVVRLSTRVRPLNHHSRLYEKEDLAALLRHQKTQTDNRISPDALELAQHALGFGDTQAASIALPRKKVHVVSADDTIGPLLLDQLHQSGQSSFLVYKDDRETIVGTLAMRDAVGATHGGRVFDLIRSDLCYVHEDFSLGHVMDAFLKTGHHTAIVINGFGEFVGMITLDMLLHQLLGESFTTTDNYESPAAIAAYKVTPETETADDDSSTKDAHTLPQTSPEATGVVE